MIGSVVGSFRITRQIGEGGMGRVYVAEHQLIGKSAAIKVLLPQFSANADVVTRFFNEARACSLLKHPGVVDIYDFGKTADGSAFIVMELLDGESLSARLQRERTLPVGSAVDIARQAASALAAAHARGIVHRDLKPDNIFLIADSEIRMGFRAKILDFGIAKLTDEATVGKTGSTRTGAIIGTPTYMSPEQCRGAGKVDHRSDIYSLGCVLYEMVSGRPPFVGEGPGDVIAAHLYQDPPPLGESVPRRLAELVLTMLAKQPDARHATMKDVAAALSSLDMSTSSTQTSSSDANILPPRSMSVPTEMHANATKFASTTTLGAAAGQVTSSTEKTGRRGVAFAAGAVFVGVAAAVAFVATRGEKTRVPAAEAAATRPLVAAAAPAPLPSAAPATERHRVKLHLASQPEGADVYRATDGVRVGRTPLDQEFDLSDGDAVFKLKLHGYADAETSLKLDRDGNRTIVLERVATKRRVALPSPATPPPTAAKPAKNGVVDPFAN